MPDEAPFRRFRLRTLRALAVSGVVFVALRWSLVAAASPIIMASRAAIVLYSAFILAFANESNAQRHGLGLSVLRARSPPLF